MKRLKTFVQGFILITLLLLTVYSAPTSQAATTGDTYYVAPSGSDANPGTEVQPWQSIQKAADATSAGDTVVVFEGTYDERVHINTPGATDAPITYRAEGTVTVRGFTVEADNITISGFDVTDTPNDWKEGWGIFVTGSNVVIENNYVHFATRGGIKLYAPRGSGTQTSNVVVRNNRLYRNAMAGIEVAGRNNRIEGNEIWGTIQYHPNWTDAPSWVDADGIRFWGRGHVIRRNYIHDISYADPENVNPHIDCFQTWSDSSREPAQDILFEQNYCDVLTSQSEQENGQGFMINDGPHSNIIIRNNIIRAFRHLNISDTDTITVVNNTFVSDLSYDAHYQYAVGFSESTRNATLKNNVFYNNSGPYLNPWNLTSDGLAVGYNCVYRSDGEAPQGERYPNDVWGQDPLFVDAAAGSYELQTGSPCVDAGTQVNVATDFNGNPRPQNNGFDIGAFEVNGEEQAASNPSEEELIIDDTHAGFSTTATEDTWQQFVLDDGQHYGNSHVFNRQVGSGNDIATWSFEVPKPGRYDVYAWWWEGAYRPTDVPYRIDHRAGSDTVTVNQRVNGGQWNLLGTFEFDGQGAVVLSDDVSDGKDVVADAIKLVYVGPADAEEGPSQPEAQRQRQAVYLPLLSGQ